MPVCCNFGMLAFEMRRGAPTGNEPTAMNVATVGEDGRPSSRMVLLKEVNAQGFVFFSNYLSRKGRALSAHPFAALTFSGPNWSAGARGWRWCCWMRPHPTNISKSRPYTSRIGAWASEQSSVIAGKSVLAARAAAVGLKHPISVLRAAALGRLCGSCPSGWNSGRVGRSRLHDRIRHRLERKLAQRAAGTPE